MTKATQGGVLATLFIGAAFAFPASAGPAGTQPAETSASALPNRTNDDAEIRVRFHWAMLQGQASTARQLARDRWASTDPPEDVMVRMRLLDAVPGEQQTRELVKLYQGLTNFAERVALVSVLNQRGKGHWTFGNWPELLQKDPTCLPALCGALDSSSPSWSAANQYGSIALDLVERGEPLAREILARMPSAARLAATNDASAMASALLRSLQASISGNSPAVQGFRAEDLKGLQASLQYHSAGLKEDVSGYDELVATKTDRPSAYYRLARWNECQKNSTRARAVVESGLQNCRSGTALLLALSAQLRVKTGDDEGALLNARRCLQITPGNPLAHFVVCEVESSRGNRAAATQACADGLACSYGWGQEVLREGEHALQRLGLVPVPTRARD